MRGGFAQALASFGVAQVFLAAVAFVRIPVTIRAIGPESFGLLALASASQLWFMVVPNGVRSAVRIEAAEGTLTSPRSQELRSRLRSSAGPNRALFGVALIGLVALWLLHPLPASASRVAEVLLVTFVLCCTQLRGSAYLGFWEGSGHFARANSMTVVSSVLGLAMVYVLAAGNGPIDGYVLAYMLPIVGPAWAAVVWIHCTSRAAPARKSAETQMSWRLPYKLGSVLAVQQLQNGIDPFIIGIAMGNRAVAVYSLASRLGAVLAMLPAACQPVLVRRFSQARAAGAGRLPHVVRISSTILAISVATLATALYLFGSTAIGLLSHGSLTAPTLLVVSVCGQVVMFSWQVPVFAALSGPAGTTLLARTLPVLGAANLGLSVFLVRFGVWGPTLASVICSFVYNAWLQWWISRRPGLFEGVYD